jgi:hypothetical protein
VTGSNSVNVFLGLGLAWLISAIYWDPDIGVGANEDWMARYPDIYAKQVARGEKPGGFVVRAGDLGFSVLIFTICALIACAAAPPTASVPRTQRSAPPPCARRVSARRAARGHARRRGRARRSRPRVCAVAQAWHHPPPPT